MHYIIAFLFIIIKYKTQMVTPLNIDTTQDGSASGASTAAAATGVESSSGVDNSGAETSGIGTETSGMTAPE